MQYEDYVKSLNKKQLEAVESDYQYLRIVAGAGSGKTRVLTYRISYLLSEMHVLPWKILAITFTNKVANEMKERVVKLVPEANKDLTIKTFHSFAAMFLRREISYLNYPLNFTILDEEDQNKLIKDIVAEKGYKRNDPIVKQALNYIGSCKLNEKYPSDIEPSSYDRFPNERLCLEIYTEYEEQKERQYALDFDDLLLKTNYILEAFPAVKMKWQERFDHILVDEFQDTNKVEYKLLRNLMKPSTCLYVVGDPDQNIYTWRGAQQDIIIYLHKSFPTLETITLEENYRSTQSILDSANKLIGFNKMRLPKNLFTNNSKGSAIVTKKCDSGTQEAEYVAREIKSLKDKYYKYSDIALLYRSNYITLDFEKAFMAHNIPYVIYGGTKFYQRMEIKDVLSFFRLISNKKDDISFERIINIPKRGIGNKTIELLKSGAKEKNISIYEYVLSDESLNSIGKKTIDSLRALIKRLEITKEQVESGEEMFAKTLEDFVIDIGYYTYLLEMDDGDERVENVKSLFEDIRHYLKTNPESTFDEYLQNVALVSAQDDIKEGDYVKLMTVHTAKGLEFPIVFVVRLNQGVFPNNRALMDDGFKALEEERRLAYVAMTRAKERLYLTYAEGFSYVSGGNLSESQFVRESGNRPLIDNSYNPKPRKEINSRYRFNDIPVQGFTFDDEPVRQNFSQLTNDVEGWKVGDVVIHKKLGRGVVVKVEDDSIIEVDFKEHGKKTILGNHPSVSKGE